LALTIRDVAQAAGVSTATVSRALRGLDNVDPKTRERIVAVAAAMKFSISPAASRLASGRTATIGIVTPFIGRWYFTEIFAGVDEALHEHDLDLLVHSTGMDLASGHPMRAHERLRRRVDGVLAVGLPPLSTEMEQLTELDVPVLLIGIQHASLSSVSIDDRLGARMAVEYLVDRGHERIALISGRSLPTLLPPENDRLGGYLEVLESRGLPTDPSLRVPGAFTVAGGEAAMNTLLAHHPRPTAVFCMSDEMAFGALRALSRHGMKAGQDVAVIGFDGHDLAEAFDLSTVAQPVRTIGRTAAENLLRQIAGKHSGSRDVVLRTHLQVRGSTGPGP